MLIDGVVRQPYKRASFSFPRSTMPTRAPEENTAAKSLSPVTFPRTWADARNILDDVGLGGPFGGRRIILMQQPDSAYDTLRRCESDVIMAIGFHQPEDAFDDPAAAAAMRTVFSILEVPNGSGSSVMPTVQQKRRGVLGRITSLIGH